ncbi:unnamed protein product [Ixodes persulcatus]
MRTTIIMMMTTVTTLKNTSSIRRLHRKTQNCERNAAVNYFEFE